MGKRPVLNREEKIGRSESQPSMQNRIVVVIGSLDRGGTERHLVRVLPRLDPSRFMIQVFTTASKGELAIELENAGVPVLGPWYTLPGDAPPLSRRIIRLVLVSIQLFSLLLRLRPRIVHFFLPENYVLGATIALLAGIRGRIMSRRSLNDYRDQRPIIWRLESALHPFMTTILANSRAVLNELISQEGVRPSRAGLIYNGIPIEDFRTPSGRTPSRGSFGPGIPLSQETLVLTIVANLLPYKGHADLIDILGKIAPELPSDWKLLVVGRDHGISALLFSRSIDAGLEGNIVLTGPRSDVRDLLQISDIGLMLSHGEGFSNAVLEYMAAGLPVVATDVGGNGEAVVDGETGFVVPLGNHDSIGERILQLAADQKLRRRMGEAGLERARRLFSIEKCVSNYERVYHATLDDRSIVDIPGIRAKDYGFY